MTRAEKLGALRRYILQGRSDARVDEASGTVTFECEIGRVTASVADLERVRATIEVEERNEQLRRTTGESNGSGVH